MVQEGSSRSRWAGGEGISAETGMKETSKHASVWGQREQWVPFRPRRSPAGWNGVNSPRERSQGQKDRLPHCTLSK